jgi:chromosome segregation ATPase
MDLGLLGWQQADYDGEILRQVQQIQELEREQSSLTNRASELNAEIRQLQSERDADRKKYEESRRALDAERKHVLAPHPQIERQLVEKRKIEPNFVKRIPDLDRELREVRRRYTELLTAETETPQGKQELVRLRERSVSIPNEKSDLRTQHLRTVSEIRALENALRKERQAIAALDERSRKADEDWQALERDFMQRIRNKEREKARVEKRIHSLEGAKVNPYQRIGQVLADSGVAPMNQPQALEKVAELRTLRETLRGSVAQSLHRSRGEDEKLLQISYLLWGGMIGGLIVVLFAAFY